MITIMKIMSMTILKKKDQNGKRGTKRGPLLAIFWKKSLRGTKNPKRDRLVITAYRSPIIVPSYCRLTRTFVNRFQPRFSLYRKVGTVLVACFSFGNDMLPTTKPFKRNLFDNHFFKIPVVHFYNPLPRQRSCCHSNVHIEN